MFNEKLKKTYVGCSSDTDNRLLAHNSGKVPSTKNFRPWKMVYTENVADSAEARKREKYYKSSAGRKKIKSIFDQLGLN